MMNGKGVPITKDRCPAAVVVVGKDAPELEKMAAAELARYIEKLSYAKPDIVEPDDIGKNKEKTLLLVSTPGTNPLAGKVLTGAQNPEKLKAGGFVIHTGSLDKHPTVWWYSTVMGSIARFNVAPGNAWHDRGFRVVLLLE